jgi:D-arabinose 1-dehydrogenase-like Zn-dependent alcohol dehydrogenase
MSVTNASVLFVVYEFLAIETEDALTLSVLENIHPMIETIPLEQAADAYARMIQGKARFRMALVTTTAGASK